MTRISQRARTWIVTVAAIGMAALTFSLGQWQLGRASQKEALQAAIEARADLPPVSGAELASASAADLAALVHRRVQLQGKWQAAQTIYLDNRPMNGRPGFWVLTPLELEVARPGAATVLVQRGWIPRDFQERTRLAPVRTPSETIMLEGRIAPAPGKLYAFDTAESGRIRQNLDIAAFAQEIRAPLIDALVLQTGVASEGLLRQWAEPATGVEKHYGYAFQWFGLCALVVGLYAWFQIFLPRRQKTKAKGQPPAVPPTD